MEIREGIRYEYQIGKLATVKECLAEKNKFFAEFDDGGTCASYTKASWVKDFKSGSIKLVEYPYKVGDWVYDINKHYTEQGTPQICQITDIQEKRIYVNGELSKWVYLDSFNEKYRPCFKDEIPGKVVKPKKEKKEDYSYLVDLFRERGIT
jgi:hypothetical protein